MDPGISGLLRAHVYAGIMSYIEFVDVDHDKLSERVRIELAQRLLRLIDKFEIFLDDDPRDFSPGQLANFLNAVKLLGSMYQVQQKPADRSGLVPADRVEKMIETACALAVAEALEAERARIAQEARLALEAAGSDVRAALARERDRQGRAGI